MEKEKTDNGYCFKSNKAFKSKKGVCYIAELSDQKYTYNDFLNIAKGNKDLAQNLFDIVDWQHPETLLEEWGREELLTFN
tara:strand:+ start:675 stop:914 length:240 start_codon:yes stop_codon:yes gene_type:complete